MKLGAIGDDFTGSSDLGLILARGGSRVTQYVGIPTEPAEQGVEAGIVALKTRSAPVGAAVEQSLAALDWLRNQGCSSFFFKYCSTFDSTPKGNIGPVIDALIDAIGTDAPVIVCPAFPATGRTVYQGHLFVGDRLLSESGMEAHPITPMMDPDLRRWLAPQTRRAVGFLDLRSLRRGRGQEVLMQEASAGRQLVVCDAIEDEDLVAIGQASARFPLLTGGSGIALGLPRALGLGAGDNSDWTGARGRALAISGSCSGTTRRQIAAHLDAGGAAKKIEVSDVTEGRVSTDAILDWAARQVGLPLVYSSDDPRQVMEVQARFGRDTAASALEAFFGTLARKAVEQGVTRLISAGGETSGAIVTALDAKALRIGPMIDPGVPALRIADTDVVLALKSGNFGAADFFAKASRILAGEL